MSGLTLTRRVGESIQIGADIVVTVTEIRGLQARITIEAPREVSVDRAEIRQAKDAEKRAAS